MGRIEKTVFISYRRANPWFARAIFQDLTHNGYDVFLDYNGIASGDFESVIIENIRARAHFLVLLTPSALERCSDPADWFRREIETALDSRRNIIPLTLENFAFSAPAIDSQLQGSLAPLKRYNALNIPADYFDEAMTRLREKFLNIPLDTVLHPASPSAGKAAKDEQAAASTAPIVTENELTAQEWFERAFNATDQDEKVRFYSNAINLNPDDAEAFYNRGKARKAKGDVGGALQDYDEALRLKPSDTDALVNRGNARKIKGDLDGALQDYDEAIRLNPDDSEAFYNRGNARKAKGDLGGALQDYDEALRLKPDNSDALVNQGNARKAKGDLNRALQDYDKAIRLKPDDAIAFYNRGVARKAKGDLDGALQDYDEAIRLDPDYSIALGNRGVVRKIKGDLDGALRDYNEAIRLNPDHADALFNRGIIRQHRNQHVAAIADFQKYLDVGGGQQHGDTRQVEQMISDLKKKL